MKVVIMVIIAVMVLAGLVVYPAAPAAAEFVCGSDLNGDGYVDGAAETADCSGTDQGYLCPIEAADCGASCPAEYSYSSGGTSSGGSSNNGVCHAEPVCDSGTYNPSTDQCEEQVAGDPCPQGGSYDSTNQKCVTEPRKLYTTVWRYRTRSFWFNSYYMTVNSSFLDYNGPVYDSFRTSSSFLFSCVNISTYYDNYNGFCPDGWTTDLPRTTGTVCEYNTELAGLRHNCYKCDLGTLDVSAGLCVYPADSSAVVRRSEPSCPSPGTLDTSTDMCETDVAYTCPLGDYACMDDGGTYRCSSYQCVDLAANPPETTTTDTSTLLNDGPADPATGECLGEIFIFNGKGSYCRHPGTQTTFFNCCNTDQGQFLFIQERCRPEEIETAMARAAGRAHYVGAYCAERWKFVGCVQKADTYCLFNSKLGRIIAEQGRPQLTTFGPDGDWGTAENPNCRGFSDEEFRMLDFGRIDLSEFFGDITTTATEVIRQRMQEEVDSFEQSIP